VGLQVCELFYVRGQVIAFLSGHETKPNEGDNMKFYIFTILLALPVLNLEKVEASQLLDKTLESLQLDENQSRFHLETDQDGDVIELGSEDYPVAGRITTIRKVIRRLIETIKGVRRLADLQVFICSAEVAKLMWQCMAHRWSDDFEDAIAICSADALTKALAGPHCR